MSGKKNLEQLFKTRFDHFDAVPSEQLWYNIEEELRKKKKRRLIPLWWKMTGIAASLMIGFLTVDYFTTQKAADDSVVVAPSNIPVTPILELPSKIVDPRPSVDENGNQLVDRKKLNQNNGDDLQKNLNPSQAIAGAQQSNDVNTVIKTAKDHTKSIAPKSSIALSEKNNNFNKTVNSKNGSIKLLNKNGRSKLVSPNYELLSQKPSDAIAHTSTNEDGILKNKDGVNFNSNNNKSINNLGTNSISLNQNGIEKDISSNKNLSPEAKNENSIVVAGDSQIERNKVTLTDDGLKKLDSIPVVAVADKVEPNALEELLNEKENNQNAPEPKINRWQVSSNVAPIYLSSISNGSPINSEFANNPKEYQNNLSYGVGVNYAVGKKLAIRTGVNRFTLGYNTKDIVVFAGVESKNLENVNLTPESRNLSVENGIATIPVFGKPTISLDAEVETTKANGVLNQQMGYIEVPLELTFKLIDKKFGVNLIGGFSTLFLDKNEVSVESNGLFSEIGEANNLNKIHVSTNVGVGMHYNIYKSIRINIEPMFKYQMNSFSNDSGSFKPYFFGVYSGISYAF